MAACRVSTGSFCLSSPRRKVPKCMAMLVRACRMKCALIVPMRTHHPPDVVEIIAEFFIKEKMRLRDGDEVKIELD